MYAIIEDSGTQIKVSEGDQVFVAKRELAADAATLTFDKVLMVGDPEDAGKTKIGEPVLEGATVSADILEEGRSDKIRVVKFKRRKNYKRVKGHRQDYIKVRITGISA